MTDLQVENPTDRVVEVDLLFFRIGVSQPYRVRLVLSPWETRNYFDVVLNRFGLENALGALRLEPVGAGPLPVRVSSRTYTQVGNGTFGQGVPGVADESESSVSRYVTGLARSDRFRTNLGAVNPTPRLQQFQIVLFAGDGALLGESAILELPPGSQMQKSLGDLFPGASGEGLTAEFRPAGDSGTPVAYAAVADNGSGDPTYYPAIHPQTMLFLPGVARVTGVGGAYFSSDVSVANPSESPVEVMVTFLERDRNNNEGAPSQSFTLGPRETRRMEDLLAMLFDRTETYGALRIETGSPDGILVSERISTLSTTTGGTVGQQVDPVSPADLMAHGSILGLRQDESFRSNVGILNPHLSPVEVTLTLRTPDGDSVGVTTLTLLPQSYVQRNLAVLFPEAGFPINRILSVSVHAGDHPIYPFAVVVDNVSQDPTFSPGLR